MNYKVTKLTKQYNGYGHFKWVIQPVAYTNNVARAQLITWRNWCWHTWGPGRELLWAVEDDLEVPWAWSTEYNHKRIYLRSDADLTVFQLKWQR